MSFAVARHITPKYSPRFQGWSNSPYKTLHEYHFIDDVARSVIPTAQLSLVILLLFALPLLLALDATEADLEFNQF